MESAIHRHDHSSNDKYDFKVLLLRLGKQNAKEVPSGLPSLVIQSNTSLGLL